MTKEVNIVLTNKLTYALVFVGILIVCSLGVMAFVGPTGVGHDFGEVDGVQATITGTCAAGSSIRAINSDGTVVCETDDIGGGWPSGHYCIMKSVRQACPAGFEQTATADLPGAGRMQNFALHISRSCNSGVGTSNSNTNRPHAQWDTGGCDNAYFLFCCK